MSAETGTRVVEIGPARLIRPAQTSLPLRILALYTSLAAPTRLWTVRQPVKMEKKVPQETRQ